MKGQNKEPVTEVILSLLKRRWLTAPQIQKAVRIKTGTLYSESTITARIRDLRKPQCGGHSIVKRSVPWSRSPVYVHAHFQDVADEPSKAFTNESARAL